jgi:hypothetical protein
VGGDNGDEQLATARAMLKSADLPGATAEYDALMAAHPERSDVASERAFLKMLAGDHAGADALLAEEAASSAEPGPLHLRRALVALSDGDLDSVKEHGQASGLPEGLLFAAEVHLADLENDEAKALLKQVAGGGGSAGAAAQGYLDLLESGDPFKPGLAEASALWALGERNSAVGSVEELLEGLPEGAEKSELLLLWAGRAVTSGEPDVAANLLDGIDFPPEGQGWRVQATLALVDVAKGNTDSALAVFQALEQGADLGQVPISGLRDARATAAALAGDAELARTLAGDVSTVAAARALVEAGAMDAALEVAPAGTYRSYLENQ